LILLDTHIFVFWLNQSAQLRTETLSVIESEPDSILLSAISVWEIAKLVEGGRLELAVPVDEWITAALNYPRVSLIPLTPEISVGSTQLPLPFHKDPADQIIVATARIINCVLITYDSKILAYPHVRTAP
jgi:PIN domain nuclease of toxin-antitoxin system